eukprot:s3515_g2.t1
MPPRAALSLLGQIAAPLQVLWIQAHILAGLQKFFWGQTQLDPLQALQVLQAELVSHAFTRWITPRHFQSRTISLRIAGEDHCHELRLESPTTVRDLLQAEKQLVGWGHYVIVTVNGQRLHPDTQLLPNVIYDIHHGICHQAKPFPQSLEIYGGGPAPSADQLGDRLIWTFMQAMLHEVQHLTDPVLPFVLYPFQVQHLLNVDFPPAVSRSWQQRRQTERGDILLICELHGHWILIHGVWNSRYQGLFWTLHDGLCMHRAFPWILQATRKLSLLLGERFLDLQPGLCIPQRHNHICGTLALLHFAQCLSLLDLDLDLGADVKDLHDWLLTLQWHHSSLYAGGSDDLQRQLEDVLTSKGVPATAVSDRAKLIQQRLGANKLHTIFKSRNPWNELKAAASRPGSMFRLITPDEQKQYVAERARTKHGARIPNHKGKKLQKGTGSTDPIHLDPEQFELNPNHFKDEDDMPVNQIHYDDVETEARGVALCTIEMARPFLEKPSVISTDALALLLLDKPAPEVITKAGLHSIIIPAKFKGTEEHTLVYGYILQLGDSKITRESASKDSSPDIVNTKVIKFQIFRDQLTLDWDRFATAPIRALVSAMDALQLCKGASCGAHCGKFHPGLDETIDNVIFELWARSFFDEQGRKAAPDHAHLFTVFMRVPEGALAKILSTTPVGVYAEPRGTQPREHDLNYKVVWLPGHSAEEAAHCCPTCDKAISLVRLKTKYGVRVKSSDEKAAWAQLRPGIEFLALDIQLIFDLFPIPHGTQRHAITKLLRDWEWPARPLNPGKGSFHHMAWRVGAQTPPPQTVMTGFGNDVVITPVRELKSSTPQQQVIASTKTQRQLRSAPKPASSSKSAHDPWQDYGHDPWKFPSRPGPLPSNEGKTRLHELQDKLSKDITHQVAQGLATQAQAAIQAAAASSTASAGQQEHRLQALEVGLQELQGHNAQFTQWFQQAGERLKATETTMGAMQQTLNSHQHEIHTLGSTFQATMKTVKDDLSSEMNDSFNKQLSRLEALLEKKHRSA